MLCTERRKRYHYCLRASIFLELPVFFDCYRSYFPSFFSGTFWIYSQCSTIFHNLLWKNFIKKIIKNSSPEEGWWKIQGVKKVPGYTSDLHIHPIKKPFRFYLRIYSPSFSMTHARRRIQP
jgi:hypothetical protein